MLPDAIKKRWLLIALLLVFVVAKIPHLFYAFYWDESWVYAPAIFMMHAHGPSLMPDAIPVEFSRGHPLLYHALCAGWMDVFGKSNFSMHCFALSVSVWLAVATHELLLRLFNKRVAIAGTIILLANVNFFAMSSFLLTDVMLALFALLSLYYYARNRYLLTAVFLTLLFYTKESGLIAAVVIGIDIVVRFARKSITLKEAAFKSASVALPLLVMFLFFAVQKHMFGWYLYPAHLSYITPGLDNTMYNMQRGMLCVFYNDQVYWLYITAAAFFTAAAIRQKKYKLLLLLLYPVLLYICNLVFSFKDVITYGFVVALIAGLIVLLAWVGKRNATLAGHFIQLVIVFSMGFFYFSCINFFEGRYLFPVLFFAICILLPVGVYYFIPVGGKKLQVIFLIAIVLQGGYNFVAGKDALVAYKFMDIQQRTVDYLEQENDYNKHICTKMFLATIHLKNPQTGFLRSDKSFAFVTPELNAQTDIVIMDNIEGCGPEESNFNDSLGRNNLFYVAKRIEKDGVWVNIYKRK